MAGMFAFVMGAWILAFWFFQDKKMFRPTLPKQMPGDGKTHYTFEPKH